MNRLRIDYLKKLTNFINFKLLKFKLIRGSVFK